MCILTRKKTAWNSEEKKNISYSWSANRINIISSHLSNNFLNWGIASAMLIEGKRVLYDNYNIEISF